MSTGNGGSENPYYSELGQGYTVYHGTPELTRAAKGKGDFDSVEPQHPPGRGKEFNSFSPSPAMHDSFGMQPSGKGQRYGLDPAPPRKREFRGSFDDTGTPMPGAHSGNPEKGIMHLLNVYADKCSLNGVIFIKSSKYFLVKIIWAILLLAALAVMVIHLYELASNYYSYQKQSKVELKFENLPFPAVTFCNVNAMKLSQADLASQSLQDLIASVNPAEMYKDVDDWAPEYEEDDEESGDDDTSARKKRQTSVSGKTRRVDKSKSKSRTTNFLDDYNFTDYDDTYGDDYDGDTYSGSWEAESKPATFDKMADQFVNLYNKETSTIRQRMGHKIQDMLVQCSYAGRKVVQKNFTLVASSTMGNCFGLEYTKFIARQSGPRQGLSLMLFLETDEYIPGITNAKGAKIVVHEPGTVPFPDDEGMAVGAGMETNVGLRRIAISRLDEPYGDCEDTDTFYKTYGIKYTRQACQEVCEMEEISSKCECYDATKPFIFSLFSLNIDSCQRKKEKVSCMKDIQWSFQNNAAACHCSSPCNEVMYRKTISSKPWPSLDFARLMAATVCKESPESSICGYTNMSLIDLRENFLKVNIYFETLNYEAVTEEEDYSEFQFISDIGGTVGLYVGLSVLSMFEIFHLLISIVRYICCGNWKKKN